MSDDRFSRAVLLSGAAAIASTTIVLVALTVASGARPRPGSTTSYDPEFIDAAVLQASWLLVPLLAVAAFHSVRVALLGVALVSITQFLAMAETVHRYRVFGWSDGLEVLGFLFPIGLTLLCLVRVLIGGLVGRSRRSDQDQ